jgi:peptidoglycan/LPS O-acetylase OafA/YrhL
MVGALLALTPPSRASRTAWIAAGTIAFAIFVEARIWTSDPYTIDQFNSGPGFTLISLGAAALIMLCIGPANRVSRLLAAKPVASIGKISYGIYLFHLPILTVLAALTLPLTANLNYFARYGLLAIPTALITVGLAALSYAGFEKRMLKLKGRFAYGEPASEGRSASRETIPGSLPSPAYNPVTPGPQARPSA